MQKPAQPGQIAFDDRGNAIYEWQDESLKQEGEAGERARNQALAHPGLAIVEEETPVNAPIRSNPKGLRVGYNPYESGVLAKKGPQKKPRPARAVEVDGSEAQGEAGRPRRISCRAKPTARHSQLSDLLLMSAAEKSPQLREPQLRALAARAQKSFFQRAAEARRVPVRFLVAPAADLVQLRQEAHGVKHPGVQRFAESGRPVAGSSARRQSRTCRPRPAAPAPAATRCGRAPGSRPGSGSG